MTRTRRTIRKLISLTLLWSLANSLLSYTAWAQSVATNTQTENSDVAIETITPVPSSNHELDMQSAINLTLTNPTLKFKWQVEQDQAGQAVSLAKSALQPQLSTVLSADVASSNVLTSSQTGTAISGANQRAGIEAIYPLYNDGLLEDKIRIAQAEQMAEAATVKSQQTSELNLTVTAFYSLIEAQRANDSQDSNVTAEEELYKTALEQYKVGVVAEVDVLSAKSAYESAVSGADQSAYGLIEARGVLAQDLGEDPSTYIPFVSSPTHLPNSLAQLKILTAQAVAAAPSHQILTSQKAADRAQLSEVRAQKSIAISVSSGAGLTASSGNSGYSYITLNFTAPLLNNEAQRAAERSAIDSIQLTDNAIQTTDNATRLAVIQDYGLYQSSFSALDAAKASADAAKAALDLAQQAYAVGKGSLAQVELAIVAWSTASLQYDQTMDQRDAAVVSLEVMTGEFGAQALEPQ